MTSSKLPSVAIVGRMNVGKSTLFNRLSINIKSLIFNYEGVTRDFIKDAIEWKGKTFELIDTGGINLKKSADPIQEEVRQRVLSLVEQVDILLFVCDGTAGVVQEDREISRLLHKLKKKIILVINKIDHKATQEHWYEFQQLGHKDIIGISAQHGRGIDEILNHLVQLLPDKSITKQEPEPQCKVAIIGKPNVGKSSLMNLLLKQERSIVAPVAGTTREAITDFVRFYQEDIQMTDTPGVRKSRAIEEPLEQMMVKSALQAVRDAHIVLLLIDASETKISDQELKLAFFVFKELYKALIIVFNKQDLAGDEYAKQMLVSSIEEYNYFLKKIETITISCKTEKNIGKILPLINEVWQRHSHTFSNQDWSRLIKDALEEKPLYHKTIPLYVYRVKQIAHSPITLLLTVNEPAWFGATQLGFFENILRVQYDLKSVPIKFVLHKS